MAILTDLSNELLLKIIADVSPLYLEFFLLSCKRIYRLGSKTIYEHQVIRNSLYELEPCNLLEEISSDAGKALYPTSARLSSFCVDIQDPKFDPNAQSLKDFILYEWYESRQNLAIPLLLNLMLNLRKLEITIGHSPFLIKLARQIVEANYESTSTAQKPLALGRLAEVDIHACCDSDPCCGEKSVNHTVTLSGLLAMIPTVKKLKLSAIHRSPYICTHLYHCGVTELSLHGAFDSTFLEDLVGRTGSLTKFKYLYETSVKANFMPQRVVQLIQQVAGDSLLYLNLTVRPDEFGQSDDLLRQFRKDLFIGNLDDLTALKTLRTSVDLLIKTCHLSGNHAQNYAKKGTVQIVQSLKSILPLHLETLELEKGLKPWGADTIERLFEDITDWKESETARLNLVNFAKCLDFEELLSSETEIECQTANVKLGYSSCIAAQWYDHVFKYDIPWEERPWIEAVKCDCGPDTREGFRCSGFQSRKRLRPN